MVRPSTDLWQSLRRESTPSLTLALVVYTFPLQLSTKQDSPSRQRTCSSRSLRSRRRSTCWARRRTSPRWCAASSTACRGPRRRSCGPRGNGRTAGGRRAASSLACRTEIGWTRLEGSVRLFPPFANHAPLARRSCSTLTRVEVDFRYHALLRLLCVGQPSIVPSEGRVWPVGNGDPALR
jgi:hypothetical protein